MKHRRMWAVGLRHVTSDNDKKAGKDVPAGKKNGDNSTEYMVEKLTRDSTDSMIVHALNLCSDISEAKGNTSDFSRFVRISGTGNIMYELII